MQHELTYPLSNGEAAPSASGFATLLLSDRHCDSCGLRRRTRNSYGLSPPGFETGLAEPCVIVGNQRSLAHLDAVVPPVRVGDHLAPILMQRQEAPGEFIQAKLLWPPDFNHAIHGWIR